MEPQFVERMRMLLVSRRAKLLHSEEGLESAAKELRDGGDVDLVDHAQSATAEDVVSTLDDRERRELGELDAALERLAEGRYGICSGCEEEIPEARLEVLPEARTCAGCA
jgi:RNA polymerase-binding transcription factor DksA